MTTCKICIDCKIQKDSNQFPNHSGRKDGKLERCLVCHKIARRIYYRKNRGKFIKSSKQYCNEHREEVLAYLRGYNKRRSFLQRLRKTIYGRIIRQLNKKEINKSERQRWADNKVALNKYHREYLKKHPQVNLAVQRRRKARIKSVGGSYSISEWNNLLYSFDNQCLNCGTRENITIDHVVPIKLGGSNDITNIQPLCLTCNLKKGARTIDYRHRERVAI